MGVRATVPVYKRRGKSFHRDLTATSQSLCSKILTINYVISLSGGYRFRSNSRNLLSV